MIQIAVLAMSMNLRDIVHIKVLFVVFKKADVVLHLVTI